MTVMTLVQKDFFRLIAVLLFAAGAATEVFSAEERPVPEKLAVKDFRPQSIYKVPRTAVEKARYPAIDMHAHPYAKTPEQVAEWIQIMDNVGIEKAIILTYETGEEFDAIYARYAKYPERFEVWCGFDYTGYDKPGFGPAAVKELERCHKLGARASANWATKAKGCFTATPQRHGECTSTTLAWTRCWKSARS